MVGGERDVNHVKHVSTSPIVTEGRLAWVTTDARLGGWGGSRLLQKLPKKLASEVCTDADTLIYIPPQEVNTQNYRFSESQSLSALFRGIR
jgi:hypothetical protein